MVTDTADREDMVTADTVVMEDMADTAITTTITT